MKRVFKGNNIQKSILIIAMLFFKVFQSNGQHSQPGASGYAPVNGIKVYYEVYGKGKPIVLLHGAFYTINMNWGQLIPELAKTYQLLGGGVSADLGPMPKSHLAIIPSQGHVSLMMQTKAILNYLDSFLR